MLDLIIIGAGPFGISLAAHAVANNLSYRILGYPMDFWKNQMPQNMFIRTPHEFVNFSDAKGEFTLARFSKETGTEVVTPLPRTVFVKYAMWFAEKTGVEFTPELVVSLQLEGDMYYVVTETGQKLSAKNVVIATGVEHYKHMPEVFKGLPESVVTHTSGYTDFSKFKGQKVAVMGSGQSAWEAAALLHMEGAFPELIYRRENPNYGGSRVAERYLRMLGNVFYKMPKAAKKGHWGQSEGSVAHFLRPYVEGKVPETGSAYVRRVELTKEGKARLTLTNGEQRLVDHILSASGFHINVDNVPFLDQSLKKELRREVGYEQFPKLDENFESSVPGLYFAGPLSSHSHGPTFRFILGLRKTAHTIVGSIVTKIHPEMVLPKVACC